MRTLLITLIAAVLAACATTTRDSGIVTISVIGTNDVHGALLPGDDRGGLTTLSGYVAALRTARADEGAVLLVDAGDMWQGTLESNLSEGASVAAAYNEMEYAAAAIGNHEFDFGPAGSKFIPLEDGDDPRGALKARAAELGFPLLAANIIDTATGEPVSWPNVRPSVIVERAALRIGIVGVVTLQTPYTTILANLGGLEFAPLLPTVIAEAEALRAAGADLVVVAAHAGSECKAFDDPYDLSSCDLGGEIMQLAQALPAGLVDHIVAGHKHHGIAHVVNGISITSNESSTRSFGRVDFVVDRHTRKVVERRVFPPQPLVAGVAEYAGEPVKPASAVVAIAEYAAGVAALKKAEPLGVYLATPITGEGGIESAVARLMTDALFDESGADLAIHNVYGGIRATLPAGELTFGSVFNMFPFDNRLFVVTLTGAELRRVVARQLRAPRRRMGFTGMRVEVTCDDGGNSVRMLRSDGGEIGDDDVLQVAINDFLALGGDDILTPIIPEQGFEVPDDAPLVRDALVDWFRARGGTISEDDFLENGALRWNVPEPLPAGCN